MTRSIQNKLNKKIKKKKDAWETFSPRGDKCPICKASFRNGCNHSVKQAKDRLFENYIKEIAKGAA